MGPAIAVPGSDLQLVGGARSEVMDCVVAMVSLILIWNRKHGHHGHKSRN